MQEIWLRTNRRAMLLGMILPAVLVAVGLLVAVVLRDRVATWATAVGWGIVGLGGLLALLVAAQMRHPRLAYDRGEIFVFLRAGTPFRIPVECVECCFLGTGAGQVLGGGRRELPMRNLVLRIADRATDYHHRDTKPALGRWEEGYVTVYGAWCEPLNVELVQQLNARLRAVQQGEAAESASA